MKDITQIIMEQAEKAKSFAIGIGQALHIVAPSSEAAPTLLSKYFAINTAGTGFNSVGINTAFGEFLKTFAATTPEGSTADSQVFAPEQAKIDALITTLTAVQTLMIDQLFTQYTPQVFDQNTHAQLLGQLNRLMVAGRYQTAVTNYMPENKDGRSYNPQDLELNFKVYTTYAQDFAAMLSDIMEIPNKFIEQKKLIKMQLRTGDIDEAKILRQEVASLEKRRNELLEQSERTVERDEETLEPEHPLAKARKKRREENKEQRKVLENLESIYETILTSKNENPNEAKAKDEFSHTITAENYQYLVAHPVAPQIIERIERNRLLLSIAKRMIRIEPGIADIRSRFEEIEEDLVHKLLSASVASMKVHIDAMISQFSETTPDEERTYRFASYATVISTLFHRAPFLTREGRVDDQVGYMMSFKKADYTMYSLLTDGVNSDWNAFKKPSKAYRAAVEPLQNMASLFLTRLMHEINNAINFVDEQNPGFLIKPTQASANAIVVKIKQFSLCYDAYVKLFPWDKQHDLLSQFIVNGENIKDVNKVINRLFSLSTHAIVTHFDTLTMLTTIEDLDKWVMCYTYLSKACKDNNVSNTGALDKSVIKASAHRLLNTAIHNLKLVDYTEISVHFRHIMNYSEKFYLHVAGSGKLDIQWVTQQELAVLLIKVMTQNSAYMSIAKTRKEKIWYQLVDKNHETKFLHDLEDVLHRSLRRFVLQKFASPSTFKEILLQALPIKKIELPEQKADTDNTITIQTLSDNSWSPDDSSRVKHESPEQFYLEIIRLVLSQNPQYTTLDLRTLQSSASTQSILIEQLISDDQLDTYISSDIAFNTSWTIEKMMEAHPGIEITVSESSELDKNGHKITIYEIKRKRAAFEPTNSLSEQNDAAVSDTVDSSSDTVSKPKSVVLRSLSQLPARAVNAAKSTVHKTGSKIERLAHNLSGQTPADESSSSSMEPKSVYSDVDKDPAYYRQQARILVNVSIQDTAHREIYTLLTHCQMHPLICFQILNERNNISQDQFNDAATAIFFALEGDDSRSCKNLHTLIDFIREMIHLTIADPVQSALWIKRLMKKQQNYQTSRAIYSFMTANLSDTVHPDIMAEFSRYLIATLPQLEHSMDLKPAEYIKLLSQLFYSQLFIDMEDDVRISNIIALVTAYLNARDLLNDYDDAEALHHHGNFLIDCIDKMSRDIDKHTLYNLILRSNVYGTTNSNIKLNETAQRTTNEQFRDAWNNSENPMKVKQLNRLLSAHITCILNSPDDYRDENELYKDHHKFHHAMLVLMNNPPEDENSAATQAMDQAFVSGIVRAIDQHHDENDQHHDENDQHHDDIHFTRNIRIYIQHLSHIFERENCSEQSRTNYLNQLMIALNRADLATTRNIEKDIVAVIKLMGDNAELSYDRSTLDQFKSEILNKKLLKPMRAALNHLNLNGQESKDFREGVIQIMNENDRKSLPPTAADITVAYRNIAVSTQDSVREVIIIYHEIQRLLQLCQNIKNWSPNNYATYLEAAAKDAYHHDPHRNTRDRSTISDLISALHQPTVADLDKMILKLNELHPFILKSMVTLTLNTLKTTRFSHSERAKTLIALEALNEILNLIVTSTTSVQSTTLTSKLSALKTPYGSRFAWSVFKGPMTTMIEHISSPMLTHLDLHDAHYLIREINETVSHLRPVNTVVPRQSQRNEVIHV